MTFKKNRHFLKAWATFTGTIVGVGIFGLPYVAMKAGFFVVLFYFLAIIFLAIIVHSLLGEVARDTHKVARIPGYAEEYIGPKAKNFAFIVSSLSLVGALLAYLIIGGEFLYLFLKPWLGGWPIFYILLFFLFGAFLIYRGIEIISRFELVMLIIFVFLLLFFLWRAIPFIKFEHFTTFNSRFLTLPYGVVLFALWGIALIPEVKEMVERDQEKLRKVIIWGILTAAFCYLIFIFAILGASGLKTSENAISGFAFAIGDRIIAIGYLFGLITTFTSFITLGLTLKKIFWYDFKISPKISWALTCFIPLTLYFIGVKNFIEVIGLTGAIALGLEAILVIFIYKNFIQQRFQRPTPWWLYPLVIALLIGLGFEIIYLLSK
ncbi:MAG: amino acid permease [Patescibacteria group bacterium]|nr:amino acid permease [Patescibacteria group bacterium]